MKAKQYAARLLESPNDGNVSLLVLDEVVTATITTALTRRGAEAMMGSIREGFSKWKSIVATVSATCPEHAVEVGIFPKMLAAANPVMYALAIEQKAFLGYALDSTDIAAADRGRREIENLELLRRLAELRREAKMLGVPTQALLA